MRLENRYWNSRSSDPQFDTVNELSFAGSPEMLIDANALGEEEFPDPAEQAAALLEVCQGDIYEARLLASTNVTFARHQEDLHYWSRVKLLISEESTLIK